MLVDGVQKDFVTEAMPHFSNVRKMALYLARNKTDAEDLLQETFMQAWKSFGKYKLGTNCRAWLFKILFNTNNRNRRRRYTKAKYLQGADEFVFLNTHSPAPVPEHLTNKEVIRALRKIPKHYRVAVVLVDVHEFSYKETARALSVPIGTVMSRLNRGRKLLRKEFVNKTKKEALNFGNKVDYFLERYA